MKDKKPDNSAIISLLNDVLTAELTAINQYFLHAELCNHWGYKKLYQEVRRQSIDEMKHAEKLLERILYLDGLPNMQKLGKLNIGETVKEQFESDYRLEEEAVDRLRKGILLCESHADHGSRILLESILVSEEEHLDWLGTQLESMRQVGEQNYLTMQLG